MNGGDANKVEIEIDLKGDAIEQVKKLAKEMENAADQTDKAKRELEQLHRVTSNLGRLRAQAGVKAAKQEEQAEQRKNRTVSSLARQRAREEEQNERRKNRVMSGLAKQRAQEEDRTAKESEQRKNRVLSGLASQRVREQERADKEEEQKRLRRNRVLSGLASQRLQEEERRRKDRPLTEMQEAGRRILASEKEERIQKLMEQMNPTPGVKGWAQRFEKKIGLSKGTLSAGPVAGIARVASNPLTWAVLAGKFGMDTARTVDHQMQYGNPYADDFVRGREQVQNLPFAREFYAASDLLSGRSAGIKRENRRRMEEDIEGRFESQRHELMSEQWQKERVASLNTRTVRDIPLPGIASTARSTQEEKRQYDLAQRLLPLQERRAEAERSAAEATNEQTANLERLRKQEEYIAGLRKKKADIEGRFKGGQDGSVPYIGALGDLTRVGRQLREAEESHAGLRDRVQQGAVNVAAARHQRAQADIAVSAGQLEDLRRRESVASSQNQKLAFAGREGRAMAMHWKRMADQFDNISDLPPEAISTLQQFFPEYMQQKGEQEGERFRREFAPMSSEYRDSVPGIRKQVDTAEKQVRGQKEVAAQDLKDAVFAGIQQADLPGLREFGTDIMKWVDRRIKDAKDQMFFEQMLKAYNLPGGGG